MIFIIDANYRIIDHNKAAARLTGYNPQMLETMYFQEIITENHRSNLMNLLHSNDEERHIEACIIKADQSTIDVGIDLKVLYSNDGMYQVVIAKDISEQKKKELDLLRYSNVIHHTINPIQITDAQGSMVYVNPAFEKWSGYSKDELIGKNPNVLKSGRHDKEFWKNVWHHILSGKIWHGHVENKRKDGNPLHAELVISPIVDEKGTVVGFLGAHRDITEQKVLEQQLARSQRMESIGTLAAGIAHEVGNPLTSISSLVQVIERTTQDGFAKEKLELIKSQVNRITRIIRDLIDFSRPTQHLQKPTDVNQIVQDALNIVRYGKKVKDVTFSLELASNLLKPHVVPDQLQQVFINILINAVDALDGKPGSISISSEVKDNIVFVKVRDSGKGIPDSDRERIFEPFFSTKAVGEGTGLGLWVSYGIVKDLGGDIHVESTLGKGSTFIISLPVERN